MKKHAQTFAAVLLVSAWALAAGSGGIVMGGGSSGPNSPAAGWTSDGTTTSTTQAVSLANGKFTMSTAGVFNMVDGSNSEFRIGGQAVLFPSAGTTVLRSGNTDTGGADVGVLVVQRETFTTAGDRLTRWVNGAAGGASVLDVDRTGKLVWPTGGAADVAGRAVLVAGTVTVATTAVAAASVVNLTNCVTGGTAGLLRVSTLTAGTSFVITSANGADTSTICWSIAN